MQPMKRRGSPWSWAQRHERSIANAIGALCGVLFIIAMTLNALILLDIAPGGRMDFLKLSWAPGFFVLGILGVLIVNRWPGHVIGWLFCVIGLLFSISWPTYAYEQFAGAEHVPLLVGALLLAQVVGTSYVTILIVIVPYLFPTGRLLSSRWRALLWIAIGTTAFFAAIDFFAVRELGFDDRQGNANPLYIQTVDDIASVIEPPAVIIALVTVIGGIASMALRYRRARGVERLQLRWALWALGVVMALVSLVVLGETFAPSLIDTADGNWSVLKEVFLYSVLVVAFVGFPLVLGLSILRYRLYDIDLIIQRTLVYGALTFGLGAAYWGGVVLLQQLLGPLTSGSGLAVAGSTLVVAALFQPLRVRIQRLVDRRFFRRKYDATTTVEAFSAQLRDAVDLDTLRADLRHVVDETMQPAHVSLWLRGGGQGRG
ncbi:MAG TPA: hypothetical protein VMM78_06480 [Thermomicrobiales bacterium]|nr:hypothetical protein [Thermomicrobiales bacterium]